MFSAQHGALEGSHPKELWPAQLRDQSSEQQDQGPGSVLTQAGGVQGMMPVTLEGRRSKGISSSGPALEWETETRLYRDSHSFLSLPLQCKVALQCILKLYITVPTENTVTHLLWLYILLIPQRVFLWIKWEYSNFSYIELNKHDHNLKKAWEAGFSFNY